MAQERLHQFAHFCNYPLPGDPPEQRRLALQLIMHHITRQTPDTWLPDILNAHGLPRYAKALDEILSL